MKQFLIPLMLSGLLLSACGGRPTPNLEASVQAAVVATLTAWPTPIGTGTPTPAPTETSTPTPTETPTPRPSATPTATPSATGTPTPMPTDTPTPKATPTRTPTLTPTPTPVVHVVEAGETLYGIARAYGVSLETLAAANDIPNIRRIQAGQELVIPASDATVGGTRPTATSTLVPADTSVAGLPDEHKALVIREALGSNQALAVKDVRIVREPGRETILVVIETQGGTGSIADETTLQEATTSIIYAYQGDRQLDVEARYVLVQAQDRAGDDVWYAVAAMEDVGLLAEGELTPAEFVERIRFETP